MKLNIGGGYKKIDGYLNVDYDAHCEPDVVCDFEKEKLPFEDNTVTDVVAHHILEHLGEGYLNFMKELYRVCQDGATIDIVVPHHRHDNFMNDPTHKRPITVEGLRMFSKKFNNYCIDIGDGCSKMGLYCGVDFEVEKFEYFFSSEYAELLNDPTEENQNIIKHAIMSFNNVICETHIMLSVVK